MTTTTSSSVNVQREADIELLKLARIRIRALQDLLARYDSRLSAECGSPAHKIEESLAWLLLRRELDQ